MRGIGCGVSQCEKLIHLARYLNLRGRLEYYPDAFPRTHIIDKNNLTNTNKRLSYSACLALAGYSEDGPMVVKYDIQCKYGLDVPFELQDMGSSRITPAQSSERTRAANTIRSQ